MAKFLLSKNLHKSFKKSNLFLYSKNKFIRTLKVNMFYRTKLRARQLSILLSATYFLNVLKNSENKKRNKLIAIDTKKYSQIELKFKNNVKIPYTVHIYFKNDTLSMFTQFQPCLVVDKLLEKAFLFNTTTKTVNIIDLKKVSVAVLHLTDNGIMENIQFPNHNFQKKLFTAYLNKAKIKTQVQLLNNFKSNKLFAKNSYLQRAKSKFTKKLFKIIKHFNMPNLRHSLNKRQKLLKRYKRTKKYSKG